jgi:hypothetical protein
MYRSTGRSSERVRSPSVVHQDSAGARHGRYRQQNQTPPAVFVGSPQRNQSPTRRRMRRWRRRFVGLVLVIAIAAGLLQQANGSTGAFAGDFLRSVIGPAATARVEATYLTLVDRFNALHYWIGGKQAQAPWPVTPATATASSVTIVPAPNHPTGRATPTLVVSGTAGSSLSTSVSPRAQGAAHTQQARIALARLAPMPLQPLSAAISPALPGEGAWTTAGLLGAGKNGLPPATKTFLRPDPDRPWAMATILQVDLRVARLHIVAGTSEPGGPIGHTGSGQILPSDALAGRLLAVFNGGFKYADGAYGLMSDGTVYVPPVYGAATIAVTRSGGVIMGTWGLDHRLTSTNSNLIAWRQNAGLLIDHGHITSQTQDGAAWGLTVLNSVYTWRSGIGLTRHGTLLYVAGNALSAATLAHTLSAAGATTAMQLDINPYWVRAFTYGRNGVGRLTAWALDPAMPGVGMEYLYGFARDFFYLVRTSG